MRIVDILNRPWAILESKFETMQDIYARHAAGERIDVEGLKAAAGDSKDDASAYTVRDGVAIIPIEGVISKRMNMFTFFSGGTSTQVLQQQISDAVSDSGVHSIVLLVDSPGGEVDGTQVAAKAIAEAKKPVVALIDGLGASAAYWLASQADQIFITDQTTWVGSIGVVTAHTDRSKANEMTGRKVTEITAGKYKRIASAHAPLSDEGKQSLQDQVDQVYSVFVDAVAAGRGVSAETVVSDMADGRVFIGQQAIDAGLVDGVSDLDAIITQLNADFAAQQQNPGQAARLPKPNRGEIKMFKTFATEAEYNAAMTAEFERGKASATTSATEIEKIKTDAAEAERKRIQSIESTPLASAHPKVIETMKFDGKSTSADAAMAILSAEEKVRGEKAKEIAEDAGTGVAASGADAGKEAEQAREREKEKASKEEDEDPVKAAAKLNDYVAAEKAKGRTVSLAQASAELNKK
jgi:signal peptide peptidase SppA